MKANAKNVAAYANKSMDRGPVRSNNVSICLPNLHKATLESLRTNYNFTKVVPELRITSAHRYYHFERMVPDDMHSSLDDRTT